jgi:hypothetical protein
MYPTIEFDRIHPDDHQPDCDRPAAVVLGLQMAKVTFAVFAIAVALAVPVVAAPLV